MSITILSFQGIVWYSSLGVLCTQLMVVINYVYHGVTNVRLKFTSMIPN